MVKAKNVGFRLARPYRNEAKWNEPKIRPSGSWYQAKQKGRV